MPQLIRAVGLVLMSAWLAGCAGLSGGSSPDAVVADGPYNIPKQIRYSYTLRNTTGQLLEKAQFSTYTPVRQTSHQKVKAIRTNLPYRSERDALGNELLHFDLPAIPPYGAKVITVTVDLLMAAAPVGQSVGGAERFTRPEPHIEADDARITALAKSLREPAAEASAKKAYDWVNEHLFAESYIAEDRGALYALRTKTGDCTEFAYLLTALYRAEGIPARPIGGYVFAGNDIVKAADYHNWTEFHVNGAWQIADAQKGAFREKQADYVAMRRIAPEANNPLTAQRFSVAGAGLEVSMN